MHRYEEFTCLSPGRAVVSNEQPQKYHPKGRPPYRLGRLERSFSHQGSWFITIEFVWARMRLLEPRHATDIETWERRRIQRTLKSVSFTSCLYCSRDQGLSADPGGQRCWPRASVSLYRSRNGTISHGGAGSSAIGGTTHNVHTNRL